MENKGLLFIPDISGFTRFINETEINHSRLIIQELLEVLINANEIGLEISEIEGDAILFYRYGDSPDLKELYSQVAKMFQGFHQALAVYDQRRYCQCKACLSAVGLSLKIITHYGEFTGYNVKNFNKLIGKDIIVAHQLLKNDIEQHEYWLVTKSLMPGRAPDDLAQWMQWKSSIKQTENGEITFQYAQLAPLKNEILSQSLPQLDLSNKTKVISVSREYETDIITLFHATGDFNYRNRWQQGVKSVEEVNHYLPRIGMRCRCIMENGESAIYSSSYSYKTDKIEFSETSDDKTSTKYYLLENKGNSKVKFTLSYYREKNFIGRLLFNLSGKKKMQASFQQSLINLEKLIQEITLPVAAEEVAYRK